MAGRHEKRSKHWHDPTDIHMADADEGGSSHLHVVSDRILRTRKRAATSEILEDSNGSSNSDNDVDDEPYRVEHKVGKGPVQQDSSEEADDEEEEESDDMRLQVVMHLSSLGHDIPLVVHRQTILGMA